MNTVKVRNLQLAVIGNFRPTSGIILRLYH